MKKAMELSLNTIIIAAVALIVLIVIAIIFTNYMGKTNTGIGDCKNKGGSIMYPEDCKNSAGVEVFEVYEDGLKTGEVCCIVLSSSDSG